jgi:lysophospholipase L1-like esterase
MEMWRYASEIKQPLPYKKLPFHHYPNKAGHYYGVSVETNSLGLRDYEYSIEKPENMKRVIFLGDSFTFGWGVPLKKLYSKQVEKMLSRVGQKAQVINMGVGNYNSIMEVELFKQKGLILEPDMVVLMYFVNDTEPVPRVKSKAEYFVLKHSYFMAFLFDRLVKLKTAFDKNFDWKKYYLSLYSQENAVNLAENEKAIKELINLCRTHQIKLVIVNIPELRSLKQYQFDKATMHIKDLAAEGKVPFLDLLPALVGQEAESLWVSEEDPHASELANRIIAEEIYDKIAPVIQ